MSACQRANCSQCGARGRALSSTTLSHQYEQPRALGKLLRCLPAALGRAGGAHKCGQGCWACVRFAEVITALLGTTASSVGLIVG